MNKNSSNKIDIDRLKSSIDIVEVIGRHVDLEKRGSEYYGLCPFHDDNKRSLQVNESKQIFKCFACGTGGDAIDFFTEQGMDWKEACEAAAGGPVTADSLQPPKKRVEKKKPKFKQIIPAPKPAKKRQASHPKHGAPDNVWKWYNENKELLGYTCRYNYTDKTGSPNKDIMPLTYQKSETFEGWKFKGFETPRPLYNLDKIAAHPERPVMIVEGEKAADAAEKLFPDLVITTWMGGGDSASHTNWDPLLGRKAVYLWPDNDDPGRKAMNAIADILEDDVAIIKGIANPEGAEKHWDVADADWTPEQAQQYVKDNVFAISPKPTEPDPEGPSPADEEPPLPEFEPPVGDFDQDYSEEHPEYMPAENDHFKFLGFEKNESGQQNFRFYVKGPKTTVRMTAAGIGKNAMMTLAPINWWESNFPKKNGMDVTAATNWLIHKSNDIGHFNDKLIRGRGAWMDKGRVVLHAGDILIVDGEAVPLGDLQTRYIYESSESLDFKTKDPLPADSSKQMIELCQRLPWKRAVNAQLLAGWCVIAPICGVLPWRPHIWLTGATGTGKSWIFKNIVSRLIGETGYAVQSETTEAGLRQLLQHDALPVVFDEAEGEDRRAGDRMDNVMALMRAASSDDGGIMVKGTSGGTAKTYQIRSCFAFASINVQIRHQSDRTRVTILEMDRPPEEGKQRRWQEFLRDFEGMVTDEFVDRLQARTINNIRVIFENSKTFAAAAAAHLGEQRQGDQLGALLAGAYSLTSDKRVTFDAALRWLEKQDRVHNAWREEQLLDGTRDEMMLFTHIMEQIVRVDGHHGQVQRVIGELVQTAMLKRTDPEVGTTDANLQLQRIGVMVTKEWIYISNYSDYIKKILRDTAWAKNHNKVLIRLDGAQPCDDIKFGSGTTHRAVKIPTSIME